MNGRRWWLAAGACLLVLAVLAVYLPAVRSGFLWEDDAYVTENRLLVEPDGLRRIWFSLDSPSQYFPLVYTSFRIERALWGLNPLGYHLVNVVLHAANALLVWAILRHLAVPGAFVAAGLFALHPVQVESAAWIAQRKNILSGLFALLAALAWLRFTSGGNRRRLWYALAVILFPLALFSKTTAAALPVVLLLVAWYRGESLARRARELAPFLLMALLMGMVTIWWERNRQGTVGSEFSLPTAEALIVAGRALWFYLGKLVWPADLTFVYHRWNIDAGQPLQYLWPLAAVAAAAGLVIGRKAVGRGPAAAFASFAVTLAPLLGFIPLYTLRFTFVADHYQYPAVIGPAALAGALLTAPARRARNPLPFLLIPALALVTLAGLSWRRAGAYHDLETIWRDTVSRDPASWLARNNLGFELLRQGRAPEAASHLLEAVRLKPDFATARNGLGLAYVSLGREAEAAGLFREAAALDPAYALPHVNLGNIELRGRRLEGAMEEYRAALRIEPGNPTAHNNLGACLARLGRYEEAVGHYRKALATVPENVDFRLNLADALAALGRPAEALENYREVQRLNPGHPRARMGAGRLSGLR